MNLHKEDALTIRWGIEILEVHPYQDTVAGANERLKVCAEGDVRVVHMKNVLAVNGVER